MSADELVKVHFRLVPDEDGYPPATVESLWCLMTATEGEVTIDNTPFFVRDATVGDTVMTHLVDGDRWFERVVSRSQNSLVRAVLFDAGHAEQVRKDLVELGCDVEFLASHRLLAVNMPPAVSLHGVQEYLEDRSGAGILDYEEPIIRHELPGEMFDSCVRAAGDLAGVFEYDGETGYFYLYKTGELGDDPLVVAAIRALVGKPDFDQPDVSVRWDSSEEKVGLFIRDTLWTVFDAATSRGFGGDYAPGSTPTLPSEVVDGFGPWKKA